MTADRHRWTVLALLAAASLLRPGMRAEPGYGDPLTLVRGNVVRAANMDELNRAIAAANSSGQPTTVLIADGTYVLNSPLLHLYCPGLVIRSESGKRDAVILRGPDEGPEATATHVFLVAADDVVIADLTLGYCRYHGIQVQGETPNDVSGLWVHNCRLVNCNEQFIKGSSRDDDPVGATDGIIENCLFEFTSGWAYQYYTGGIDIHKGVRWQVRDNLFRNIRVPADQSGMAEHAIHFWKRCPTEPQDVVVERNWIVNCDRGIGFGLVDLDGGHQGGQSAIRNNFVFNDGTGPKTDTGIGLEYADGVRVDNNTVVVLGYWAPIEYRFPASSNLVFRNNLVNGPITRRNSAPDPVLANNVEAINPDWFKDLAVGDLHLTPRAASVIDAATALGDFTQDIDGESRPLDGAWDIGADEYSAATADSDNDGMSDLWETNGALDPLSAVGNDGPAGDPDQDRANNWHEYQADTHPNDSNSFLGIGIASGDEGALRIVWHGGAAAVQELESTFGFPEGAGSVQWGLLSRREPPTPTLQEWRESLSPSGPRSGFYRIRAWRPD